jgi:hypothetical protein
MKEYKCKYCHKKFDFNETVVLNQGSLEIFCAGAKSPLEPGSCGLRYLEKKSDEKKFGKSDQGGWFFIELKSYEGFKKEAKQKKK